jgi:hypothetical protein
MFVIAHRGNRDGPNPERENSPAYIIEALNEGFDVEIDVRYNPVTNGWWLGHDMPQYHVDVSFLQNRRLWCHAKNLATLSNLQKIPGVHYFSHDKDDAVLTSNGIIWVQPGEEYDERCVCVMPELAPNWDLSRRKLGVCSDMVRSYLMQ